MNMFPDYEAFLRIFREKGYAIDPLVAGDLTQNGVLYMRHDIDFDVELALEMARIEARLGARATYFLMLTSDNYNLFSGRNAACVQQIKALGHKVSIHFDPVRHEDFETGLSQEITAFEAFFKTEVDLISLHRPNDFFLSHDQNIGGVAHTYQSKYLKDIKYVADSRGSFRFGPPEETDAFARGASIHLLIHPVWWVMPSPSPQETLDAFTLRRLGQFQDDIEANCLAYSRAASRIAVEI
ncbi:MAG: hypothetical protein O9254_00190 [Rhodobacteraceae bacterium]|nr:hypothetical protein [Paracoccaceae bacterium]